MDLQSELAWCCTFLTHCCSHPPVLGALTAPGSSSPAPWVPAAWWYRMCFHDLIPGTSSASHGAAPYSFTAPIPWDTAQAPVLGLVTSSRGHFGGLSVLTFTLWAALSSSVLLALLHPALQGALYDIEWLYPHTFPGASMGRRMLTAQSWSLLGLATPIPAPCQGMQVLGSGWMAETMWWHTVRDHCHPGPFRVLAQASPTILHGLS